MDGEAAEIGDAASAIRPLEAHRPRALGVDLDDENAERLGIRLRLCDLGEDLVATLRTHGCEERLDVRVRDELDEEVRVVRPCATDRYVHAADSCTRVPKKRWPDASAAPTTMRPNPASIAAVTASSRKTAPYATANTGMR